MTDTDTAATAGTPPSHLQAAGKAFYLEMTDLYQFDPPEKRLLTLACSQLDAAERFRRVLRREGITFAGRYGPQIRPEVAAERQAQAAFKSLVKALDLPSDTEDLELPPRSEWSNIVPRRRGQSFAQWEGAVREKVARGV